MLESFPKVQRWQAALIESGLTDKTVPADFIDKFSGFYLTNNYLASLAEAR